MISCLEFYLNSLLSCLLKLVILQALWCIRYTQIRPTILPTILQRRSQARERHSLENNYSIELTLNCCVFSRVFPTALVNKITCTIAFAPPVNQIAIVICVGIDALAFGIVQDGGVLGRKMKEAFWERRKSIKTRKK